eukprot:365123-Chlamydomonas_euryale.AAC.49
MPFRTPRFSLIARDCPAGTSSSSHAKRTHAAACAPAVPKRHATRDGERVRSTPANRRNVGKARPRAELRSARSAHPWPCGAMPLTPPCRWPINRSARPMRRDAMAHQLSSHPTRHADVTGRSPSAARRVRVTATKCSAQPELGRRVATCMFQR